MVALLVLRGRERAGLDGVEGEQATEGVRHTATTPARAATSQVSVDLSSLIDTVPETLLFARIRKCS